MHQAIQRADYNDEVLKASLRASQIRHGVPLSYTLVAFHVLNGRIDLPKLEFHSVPDGIAYATKYGIQAHKWSLTFVVP
jgi:hypothetical protein